MQTEKDKNDSPYSTTLSMPITLVCTDFDGTLYKGTPDAEDLLAFRDSLESLRRVHGARWAIVTGRPLPDLVPLMGMFMSYKLFPDFAVVADAFIFKRNAVGRFPHHRRFFSHDFNNFPLDGFEQKVDCYYCRHICRRFTFDLFYFLADFLCCFPQPDAFRRMIQNGIDLPVGCSRISDQGTPMFFHQKLSPDQDDLCN